MTSIQLCILAFGLFALYKVLKNINHLIEDVFNSDKAKAQARKKIWEYIKNILEEHKIGLVFENIPEKNLIHNDYIVLKKPMKFMFDRNDKDYYFARYIIYLDLNLINDKTGICYIVARILGSLITKEINLIGDNVKLELLEGVQICQNAGNYIHSLVIHDELKKHFKEVIDIN